MQSPDQRTEVVTSDLTDLATQINAEHEQVKRAFTKGFEHALKAGGLLLKAKQAVPHGQWLPWLEANVEMARRSAQIYMRLAREWPKLDPEKAQRVAHLSLRDAIASVTSETALVAKLPKAVVADVLANANAGERLRGAAQRALDKEQEKRLEEGCASVAIPTPVSHG